MNIKRWIYCPDGMEDHFDSVAVLEVAGRKLDRAYANEIVGECLFEGEDGKVYVGTVEFVISEANPEYVKEVMEATPSGEKGEPTK